MISCTEFHHQILQFLATIRTSLIPHNYLRRLIRPTCGTEFQRFKRFESEVVHTREINLNMNLNANLLYSLVLKFTFCNESDYYECCSTASIWTGRYKKCEMHRGIIHVDCRMLMWMI